MSMVMVILDDDEVFVGDDQIFAVDLAQDLRLQDLVRSAECKEFGFEKDAADRRESGSC